MSPARTMSVEEFRALGKKARVSVNSKYGSVRVEHEGIVYHSKAELAFELHLRLLKQLGIVSWWTRQVPFYLPGGKRYLCDFLVRLKDEFDGPFISRRPAVCIIDVKGCDTKVSALKRSVLQGLTEARVELVPAAQKYSWGLEWRSKPKYMTVF